MTAQSNVKRQLIQNRDSNCMEYRLDGILLSRCLIVNSHPQEHMISVVRRIREFVPDLPEYSVDNYRAARDIWDARRERE